MNLRVHFLSEEKMFPKIMFCDTNRNRFCRSENLSTTLYLQLNFIRKSAVYVLSCWYPTIKIFLHVCFPSYYKSNLIVLFLFFKIYFHA